MKIEDIIKSATVFIFVLGLISGAKMFADSLEKVIEYVAPASLTLQQKQDDAIKRLLAKNAHNVLIHGK